MLNKNIFIGLGLGYLAAKAARRNPDDPVDYDAVMRRFAKTQKFNEHYSRLRKAFNDPEHPLYPGAVREEE